MKITFLNLTVTKYNSQVSGALFRDGLPNFQRYFKSDSQWPAIGSEVQFSDGLFVADRHKQQIFFYNTTASVLFFARNA